MDKEFVTYELALALKELGFDELCIGCYDENRELIVRIVDYRSFSDSNDSSNIIRNFNSYQNGTLSAPLYQQAFKFVLSIIENDSKLDRKFMDRFFLDFTYEGFVMDDRELYTTYESDEETLANITNFIILNK